jgi:hypothetical protein
MSKTASAPHQLTLPPNTILKVEVVESTKPPTIWDQLRPIAYYAFATVIIVATIVWWYWVKPVAYVEPPVDPTQTAALAVTLVYPQFVSRGDEGVIDVTITNITPQPISGTLVLDFGNPPPITTLDNSTNVLTLKDLPPRGNQSLHLRFSLAQSTTDLSPATLIFTPRVTLDSGEGAAYQAQSINVTPIPMVRTLLNGALGLAALYGLLWAQIQKRLLPSK